MYPALLLAACWFTGAKNKKILCQTRKNSGTDGNTCNEKRPILVFCFINPLINDNNLARRDFTRITGRDFYDWRASRHSAETPANRSCTLAKFHKYRFNFGEKL